MVQKQISGLFHPYSRLDRRRRLRIDQALQAALGLGAGEARPRRRFSLNAELARDPPSTNAPLPVPTLSPARVSANRERSSAIRPLEHPLSLPIMPVDAT